MVQNCGKPCGKCVKLGANALILASCAMIGASRLVEKNIFLPLEKIYNWSENELSGTRREPLRLSR